MSSAPTLTFLGSGDAFGSGGRFMTCFQVVHAGGAFLVDCGASSMVAIRRFGVDPNGLDAVFVSHLHGDHFGGLPFFLLDAQFVSRRERPLTLVGPPGFGDRLHAARETLFPGSAATPPRFALDIVELAPMQRFELGDVAVTPFEVRHFSGAPPFALRFEIDGRVLAYSGDTEWTEALVPAARNADLFVCEAYVLERKVKWHMDVATLVARLPEIGARRVILTHMSDDMLGRPAPAPCEKAEDGMTVSIG
ncbi:MAG: MBL fold metallo-hydrolase [Pseudomonadota bacterium]